VLDTTAASYEKKNGSTVKVLYVTSLLNRMGGAEKNLVDILLNINRKEFSPGVLALVGGELTDWLTEKGIKVEVNNLHKIISLDALKKGRLLYNFLKKEKIDVMVTYHHDADIWGGIIARLAGVPVISSRRDMGYQLETKHIWFYRLFNRIFSHFITVSDAVKNEIVKREWINPEKVVTIHNGLKIELYDQTKKKEKLTDELGLKHGKIVIGMVASFRPIKGQEFLVETVGILVEEFPDIQVVIVGYNDTEYFQKILTRIEALHLQDYFIFTGNRNDVQDILHLFDIFVISSLHEGFSNAIIEAMAAGKPVLAPDSGGNAEAVEDGETGLLFKPCDSSSLAKKLRELLENKISRIRMGNNGREAVEKKFLLEQMIAKNENLLQKVVGHE
jgi:glycosyltransferase involved in cell wall biosynthesis